MADTQCCSGLCGDRCPCGQSAACVPQPPLRLGAFYFQLVEISTEDVPATETLHGNDHLPTGICQYLVLGAPRTGQTICVFSHGYHGLEKAQEIQEATYNSFGIILVSDPIILLIHQYIEQVCFTRQVCRLCRH